MTGSWRYCGFHNDGHGLTDLGRIVLDGWLFGLIPEREDCTGWELSRMQALLERIEQEWDKYGNLPSRLPEALRARHAALYGWAIERARSMGWEAPVDEE